MLFRSEGGGQGSDIEIQAAEIQRMREEMEGIFAHHTGRAAADIRQDIERDKILTADQAKEYGIVDQVVKYFQDMQARGDQIIGQPIRDLVTVNGVRITAQDGTWGLVRASSNKPELVVVVESPVSEARMREMFAAVDSVLRQHPEVGAYNQTI